MLHILLATTRPEALHSFSETLSADPEVRLELVPSGEDTLHAVRTSPPQLVVIDFELPDFKPLDLVRKLLMVNAMVATAVVSHLSEQRFHEVSEGLGVLARIPEEHCGIDAVELLGKLRRVLGQS